MAQIVETYCEDDSNEAVAATPDLITHVEVHKMKVHPELPVGREAGAGEVGRGDDRPGRAKYVELGVKAANAADGAAGVEQQSQGLDIAHAFRELREIEAGDDLEGIWSWGENSGESAGLNKRAHDPKLGRIPAKAVDELGVPALVDETECHSDLIPSLWIPGGACSTAISAIPFPEVGPAIPAQP